MAKTVVIVNRTGYNIKDLYISPSGSSDWGDDVLEGSAINNGGSLEVVFHPKATAKLWDLSVGWVGYDPSEDVHWEELELMDCDKITLFYNESTEQATAKLE